MNNAATYTMEMDITGAGTFTSDHDHNPTGLDGIGGASIDLQLAYGSGGTTVDAYAQTSLDGQRTWQDVAHYQFAMASGRAQFHVSASTTVLAASTPGDGVLSGNVAVSGILGPDWRLKVIVAGTYGSSTVATLRLVVR